MNNIKNSINNLNLERKIIKLIIGLWNLDNSLIVAMVFNAQINYNKFVKEFKPAQTKLTLKGLRYHLPQKVLFYKVILPIFYSTMGANSILELIWWPL